MSQRYAIKADADKNTCFQDRYSEPRRCAVTTCNKEFRVRIAYWDGYMLVRRFGAVRKQKYCSDECKRRGRLDKIKENRIRKREVLNELRRKA